MADRAARDDGDAAEVDEVGDDEVGEASGKEPAAGSPRQRYVDKAAALIRSDSVRKGWRV